MDARGVTILDGPAPIWVAIGPAKPIVGMDGLPNTSKVDQKESREYYEMEAVRDYFL